MQKIFKFSWESQNSLSLFLSHTHLKIKKGMCLERNIKKIFKYSVSSQFVNVMYLFQRGDKLTQKIIKKKK